MAICDAHVEAPKVDARAIKTAEDVRERVARDLEVAILAHTAQVPFGLHAQR
jgi:hypothetical protein